METSWLWKRTPSCRVFSFLGPHFRTVRAELIQSELSEKVVWSVDQRLCLFEETVKLVTRQVFYISNWIYFFFEKLLFWSQGITIRFAEKLQLVICGAVSDLVTSRIAITSRDNVIDICRPPMPAYTRASRLINFRFEMRPSGVSRKAWRRRRSLNCQLYVMSCFWRASRIVCGHWGSGMKTWW